MSEAKKKANQAEIKKLQQEEKKALGAVRVGKVFALLTVLRSRQSDISKIKKWDNFIEATKDPVTRDIYMRTYDEIKGDPEKAYGEEKEIHAQAVKIADSCKI